MALTPTLLLRPEGSRDRQGTVTPTINGDVTVVAGQYGQAWRCDGLSEYLILPAVGRISATTGTVLIRGRFHATGSTYLGITPGATPNRLYLGRANGLARLSVGGDGTISGVAVATDTLTALAAVYTTSAASLYTNGQPDGSTPFTGGVINVEQNIIVGGYAGVTWNTTVESVAIYDQPLSSAQVQAISTMPQAWTWEALTLTEQAVMSPILRIGSPHIGPMRVGKD